MAVLRLYAAARKAAGTATDEVPGRTVDEVLAAARARYGVDFGAAVGAGQVWCNGERVAGTTPVVAADEVSVIPSVSGGAGEGRGPNPERGSSPGRRRPPARPAGPLPPAPWEREVPDRGPGPDTAPVAPVAPPPRRDGTPPDPPRTPRPRPGAAPTRPTRPVRPAGPGGAPAPAPRPGPARGGPPGRVPATGGAPATGRAPATGTSRTPAPPTSTSPTGGRPEDQAGRLTRMRSVAVPVTGHVRVWGKERPVSGPRVPTSPFGRRYAVVYDTSGWKVTLGVAWFVLALAATVQGWAALSLLYGVAAGWAGLETARHRAEAGSAANPWVAALGAGVVAAAGGGGTGVVGVAVLALVAVAVATAALDPDTRDRMVAAAGATIWCSVPVGLAAAAVVLTRDLDIGAAVVLLVFVSCYEAGDFLIGSGASNRVEGPVVGMLTIGVAAVVVAGLQVPPFDGQPVFTFAALAAVAAPLGQLLGSALLPTAGASAPALRRLDSLLLLAPAWCWTVGLFVDSVT